MYNKNHAKQIDPSNETLKQCRIPLQPGDRGKFTCTAIFEQSTDKIQYSVRILFNEYKCFKYQNNHKGGIHCRV